MNKKTITDLIQRIDTSTIDGVMAEVLKLPLEWQVVFALDLCRRSRTGVEEGEFLRRIRVAFANKAFRAWAVANEDKIPTV